MGFYFPSVNETGIIGLLRYDSTVTNGLLGPVILLLVFMILFSSFKSRNQPTAESIVASLFASFVVAIPLWLVNILADTMMGVVAGIWALSIILLVLHNQ